MIMTRTRFIGSHLLAAAVMIAACGKTPEEPAEIPVRMLESGWLLDFESPATQVRWNPDFDSTASATQEWEFFRRPRIMVLSPFGDLVISDTGNARIVRVSQTGERIETIGRRGDGPGEFREPSELGFVPGTSELWVVDRMNGRIARFHLTASSSTFLAHMPSPLGFSGNFTRTMAVHDSATYWIGGLRRGYRITLYDREGATARQFGDPIDVYPASLLTRESIVPVTNGGNVYSSPGRGEVFFTGDSLPILERWSSNGELLAYRDPIFPDGPSTADLRTSHRISIFSPAAMLDMESDIFYVWRRANPQWVYYAFDAVTLDVLARYEAPRIGHLFSTGFVVTATPDGPIFYILDAGGRGIEKLQTPGGE